MIKSFIYPLETVQAYAAGKISRQTFCDRLAKKQSFKNEVKARADGNGNYVTYRGRTAQLVAGALTWDEKSGAIKTAHSIKEMKVKIDIAELTGDK